jgi:redox-sensitive bicupin YhaK (pirin superfamily)
MSGTPSVDRTIEARTRGLVDGFTVRRLLPATARRMVGPFIFFDHMGPTTLAPDQGLDVRPHPHIGLATVTYLFEGELLHRDSLGTEQVILPGAVNWMTSGRGIVHSERSPVTARKSGPHIHALQLWVALPLASEEGLPSFQHHKEEDIPELSLSGARIRIVAGSVFGETAPVEVLSPLFYVDARLDRNAEIELPDEHRERAAYVVDGSVSVDGTAYRAWMMVVFREGAQARLQALEVSRVILLGGAPLDGERHIWWNFVSSSRETIERAKQAWRERAFPTVPGEENEFVPLPDKLGRIR